MPHEYYKLTPVEFGYMYYGYLESEKKQQKRDRMLNWHIIKGYADPKTLPSSMEAWWPIDEDDLTANKSPVEIDKWSDDVKQSAIDLIKQVTGG